MGDLLLPCGSVDALTKNADLFTDRLPVQSDGVFDRIDICFVTTAGGIGALCRVPASASGAADL